MVIRVLGSAGAELPDFNPPAFLVDDILLLDAGTIGAVLSAAEQERIRHVFLTHAHLDHVRGIPFLADNIVNGDCRTHLEVASIPEVIATLRTHLLNDAVWPDFSHIPTAEAPVISYREIVPEQEVRVAGYDITAYRVNHPVPAVGYVVRKGDKALLYSGDTGPTDRLWKAARGLTAMIVEVSFPNKLTELALKTGHLTSRLLAVELGKLAELPPRIFITHPKPQYYDLIRHELSELGIPQLGLLRDGLVLTL